MRNGKQFKKHRILPDKVYNSFLISKIINIFMLSGKKSICENIIVYPALLKLKKFYFKNIKNNQILKTEQNLIEKILLQCLKIISVRYIIKTYKFGGAKFKIPVKQKFDENDGLEYPQIKALRILSKILRNRGKYFRKIRNDHYKGMSASEVLFLELSKTFSKKSEVYKIISKIEKTAIDNKAFSHLIKYKKK